MSKPFDLRGRLALVTGGGSGIGRGIAAALAAAGADLVLCGRRIAVCETACAELRDAANIGAFAYQCDVGEPGQVEAMVEALIARFGRIDILVNNAGIGGAAQSVLEIDLSQWQRTLAINLTGAFLCSQAVARHMVRQGRGKIINVASVGSFLPLPHAADYCASKGGLLMLTRAMALELIRHGVHVNAICPGFVETELNGDTLRKMAAEVQRRVPAGRMGQIHDIGGAAVFLASEASDYVVGAHLVIDGGVMLR